MGIEPMSLLYESNALPLSYIGLFFSTNTLASLYLLLKERFFLPFPLFSAAYVGVNESQLGQSRRRFDSMLLRQLPSIWSATRGTLPDFGLILAQPHKQHLFSNFSLKYRLTCAETTPMASSPWISPCFHFRIYIWCWYLAWHLLLQYLYPGLGTSFWQVRHFARGFFGIGILWLYTKPRPPQTLLQVWSLRLFL